MSVLKVKNGNQWDIVPAIKGDPGDPAADESITDDMLVTDGIKTEIEWLWGNQLTDSREGEILHAEDAYTAPAVDISVDGKSTQDGTPTPDAPVEIVSLEQANLMFAGKNLCRLPILNQWTSANGVINSGQNKRLNVAVVEPYTDFTLSCTLLSGISSTGTGLMRLNVPNGDSTAKFISLYGTPGRYSITGKTHSDGEIFVLTHYTNVVNSKTGPNVVDIQLELGSTATDYEPYLGNTASLLPDGYSLRSLPAGTKDELHLSYFRPSKRAGWAWYSRELVQRVDIADLGELTWNSYTYSEHLVFRTTKLTTSRSGFCMALAISTTNAPASLPDNSICLYTKGWSAGGHMMARADAYESAAAFKSGMSGVLVQYLLDSPITTQLDPIELPIMPSKDATIWSDPATNLKMTYIQDSNLIIENLEATIADIATS